MPSTLLSELSSSTTPSTLLMMASTLESTANKLSKLRINGDFASSSPNLHKNLHLLSPDQVPSENEKPLEI